MKKPKPLIICGLPKSGTTLLASLLDGHPELNVFPTQTNYVHNVANSNNIEINNVVEKTNLNNVLHDSSLCQKIQAKVNSNFSKSSQSIDDVYTSLFKAYHETINTHIEWENLAYFSEKTTRSELNLSKFRESHHDYKAIYIMRDPLDIYASWRERWRTHNKKELTTSEFYYNQLMSIYAWLRLKQQYTNQHLLISYEDLVKRPECTTEKIANFLEINWQTSLLIPTKNNQLWKGNSTNKLEYSKISDSSVGSYKKRLSPKEINEIENTKRLFYQAISSTYKTDLSFIRAVFSLNTFLIVLLLKREVSFKRYLVLLKFFMLSLFLINKHKNIKA